MYVDKEFIYAVIILLILLLFKQEPKPLPKLTQIEQESFEQSTEQSAEPSVLEWQ
jgi:hypothetical protein